MRIEDSNLIATGPRGKEFELANALENVFTSDLWLMPVIRFFIDTNTQTVISFEANSPRNRKVIFQKDLD